MATPASPPAPRRRGKSSEDAPAAAPEAVSSPAIDQVLGELERVVAELEAGELPLESALKRFEDGVRLARQGGQLLDAVEQRVEMLLEGRDGTVPFPGANDDDAADDTDDDNDDDDSV
jgi:exodeoxyribonuclease VII small subunit